MVAGAHGGSTPARRIRRAALAAPVALAALAALVVTGLGACSARDSADPAVTGDAGSPDGNGGPTTGPDLGAASPEPITIEMFSDAIDLPTGSTQGVTVTATLIDDQRLPMSAAPVEWSASGGVLQDVSALTDANGRATAVLRMPQDFRNRRIEVGASSGPFGERIAVTAYGTTLEVQGGERSVVIGNDLELVVTLAAGNGDPIVNRALVVTAANGNRVSPAEPLTDPDGRVTLRIGSALGDDTVTIAALDDPSLTRTIDVDVSTDQLAFSSANGATEFGVNRVETVEVLWTDGGQPVAGGELRITTSAGQLLGDSVLLTDAGGRVRIPVSSASAGDAQIRVQDANDGDPSGSFDIEFVATTPALVDVSTTTSRVFVNERADIGVRVRDVSGNPVKNRVVVFASNDLFGGQLAPSSAITDSDGRVSTVFTAGGAATGTGAIEIFATVQGAAAPGGGALADSVRLSAVERRLNVTLGAGTGLESIGLDTQYALNLVVQVADGSGVPLPEADVSLSITPIGYTKGRLVPVDRDGAPRPEVAGEKAGEKAWVAERWGSGGERGATVTCPAEDVNGNRILDARTSEDTNGNGILDPQDPAVLSAVTDATNFATLQGNGTLVTDANGSGYFRLAYPKGNALWARLRIVARVNALGTEGQDSLEMPMPALAGDLADLELSPANLFSPYGLAPDCTDPG